MISSLNTLYICQLSAIVKHSLIVGYVNDFPLKIKLIKPQLLMIKISYDLAALASYIVLT